MHLEINESENTISAQGLTVELYAKEFALFRFLYLNRGRTFSREQLLDKVWPLEYPVERTVDDHIYRLRKKLGGIEGLHIRTVRGFGYCMEYKDYSSIGSPGNPSAHDPELQASMRDVFVKYQQYGQGKSMLTLARQQDILGYELDPFYLVYIHFVQGDLEWMLSTNEVPLVERLYSLLLFYIFSGEPEGKLASCEQVLAQRILPPFQHQELEILNILELYTLAGKPELALERLKLTNRVIADPGMENFRTVTAIAEMFVHLVAGTSDEELQVKDEQIQAQLLEKPYLREIGNYKTVKGLWRLRSRKWGEAGELLDEGLRVLEMSGFVPLRLNALYRIQFYSGTRAAPDSLQRKYNRMLEEEKAALGMDRLKKPLEAAISGVLDPGTF